MLYPVGVAAMPGGADGCVRATAGEPVAGPGPVMAPPAAGDVPVESVGLPAGGGTGTGRLVVVRHGQTAWSRSGRHTGRTDQPLLPEGEVQARQVGALLGGRHFAAVRTSPRQRAVRTCELAGFGEAAVVDPDLAEWDYGAFEGLTTPEIQARRPGWLLWSDGVEGGERLEDVAARADRVIAAVRARAGDTLVFAHGHLLRVLAARWLGLAPGIGRRFSLNAGALGVLGWEHDEPVMRRWNLTAGDPLA